MRNFPIPSLVGVFWGCLAAGHFFYGNTPVGIGFMALCHLASIEAAIYINNR